MYTSIDGQDKVHCTVSLIRAYTNCPPLDYDASSCPPTCMYRCSASLNFMMFFLCVLLVVRVSESHFHASALCSASC